MHLAHTEAQIQEDSSIHLIGYGYMDGMQMIYGINEQGNRVEFYMAPEYGNKCIISVMFVPWEDVVGISTLLDGMYGRQAHHKWWTKTAPIVIELRADSTKDDRPWVVGYIDPNYASPDVTMPE